MALRAIGTTYPNPPVGAVIVNNGIILSRGWTQPKGVPHAEIHAINQIKNKNHIQHIPDETLGVDVTIILGKDINSYPHISEYISQSK